MNELSDKDKKLWEWAVKGNQSLKSPPRPSQKPIPSAKNLKQEMEDFLLNPQLYSAQPPEPLSLIGARTSSNFPIHTPDDPSFSAYFFEKSLIKIDLHGLTQEVAYTLLKKSIKDAFENETRSLLVITGKGTGRFCEESKRIKYQGTLLLSVPRWLQSYPFKQWVDTTEQVPVTMGGEGAIKIIIKRKNRTL